MLLYYPQRNAGQINLKYILVIFAVINCYKPIFVFSRSHCAQYDWPLASQCRPGVCLWCWALWL